jgi:hypothetical protein
VRGDKRARCPPYPPIEDSSVADYRKCLAAFPNNPKACEAKRLIVETNERRIQQDDRQAVSDPTTALKSN